jgi:hypothetical protein
MELTLAEIIEWIEQKASSSELSQIEQALGFSEYNERFVNNSEGTYSKSEKIELLSRAFSKYSLAELEKRLGTKWDLV